MQTRNVKERIVRAFGGSQFTFCANFVKRVNARISRSIRSAERQKNQTFLPDTEDNNTSTPADVSEESSTQLTNAESTDEDSVPIF